MTPYRTLVFARIVQESALSVGGNRPHGLADSPLARDGQNRPVLRGSTLAGCFIASARRLVDTLPRAISSGGIEAQRHRAEDLVSSSWRFAHAHPLGNEPEPSFFQHVSIDARTHAAKDDHLFNLEAVPAGTSWNFELEIAPAYDTDFADLEALAAAVLATWQQTGGARLGRGSRHGYGWCHLEDIHIVRLDSRHIRLWPDAFAPERDLTQWMDYFRNKGVDILTLSDFVALHAARIPKPNPAVVELSGTVQVGERQDDFGKGYGLDTLSIGGHASMRLQSQDLFERVIPPPGMPFSPENFDPDFTITAIPDADGKLVPYIPGASIRGVWRGLLERHYRANNQDLSLLDTLFGSTERAGHLSIADAKLVDDDWSLLWQQHVAIDEFTGGAYSSAKFDRLCIAHARFDWRACIEAESLESAEALAHPLRELLQALGNGHLPLGGGIWRGHGHIRWTLNACTLKPAIANREGAAA